MNCKEINHNYRIVDYLAKKNIYPIIIKQKTFWFLSPFRNEKTCSFKVDDQINLFYDFGEGAGGTLIDLITRLENISIKQILHRFLNQNFSFQKHKYSKQNREAFRSNISIIETKEIYSYPLKNYLKDRNIKSDKAYKYLKEIIFKINNGSIQFALGFQNIDGKYELRNKIFKGCSGKNLSMILNNKNENRVFIFEGFFDFLSFMELNNYPNFNFVVMNSIANSDRLLNHLNKHNYSEIHLYLDNDKAGDNYTNKLINQFNKSIIDHRTEYKNYKDLNEFLFNEIRIK